MAIACLLSRNWLWLAHPTTVRAVMSAVSLVHGLNIRYLLSCGNSKVVVKRRPQSGPPSGCSASEHTPSWKARSEARVDAEPEHHRRVHVPEPRTGRLELPLERLLDDL